jgi:quercetin 2,3-dioxygenase
MASLILSVKPLGFTWPVNNPFIFCAHHSDRFPAGDAKMGPKASLDGRQIGQDFDPGLPWRMYHGRRVPGFPAHPHRGFETITIVTEGMVDHSDSHGQAGRYGRGDVQWMTAGSGLQHSEMFPLLNTDSENPLELFQVWLNLPAASKMAEPYFKMLWAEDIPVVEIVGPRGSVTKSELIAGQWNGIWALPPAPDSWAANPENEVNIWNIHMNPGAELRIPPAGRKVNRSLYFYRGSAVRVGGETIESKHGIELKADKETLIEGGFGESHFLLLQGRMIDEPIYQYGPFVMNTAVEIQQAYADFQHDGFGGWPWPNLDHVHPAQKGRFARHRDGSEENR